MLALISVLVRTRERFLYICGGKREETGFGKIFPLGKRGDYKEISLSSTIDDDGCAVASRHVTTRTTPRAAFFLLPLFSLSLPLFFVFSIRLFIFVSRRSDVSIAQIGVERYAFVCYLKSSRRRCCCCCCLKQPQELLLPFLRVLLLLPFLLLLHLRLELVVIAGVDLAIRREHLKDASVFRCLLLGRR